MTANNFANRLDGYISRILPGLKPSKRDMGYFSRRKDVIRAFGKMEVAITRIAPLLRRGEADV